MPKSLIERIRSSSAMSPILNSPRTVLNKPFACGGFDFFRHGFRRSDKRQIVFEQVIEIGRVFGDLRAARIIPLHKVFRETLVTDAAVGPRAEDFGEAIA